MTRNLVLLITLPWLAACGVDGAPTPPAKSAPPGISIAGQVEIGVAGR